MRRSTSTFDIQEPQMDFGAITAALGSIKTATEIAKYIKETDLSLEKAETKLKLADLISALADAKLEVVGVQQSLAEAEGQIETLEKQLQVRANLTWEEPYYWLNTASGRQGPFCQKCYDTGQQLVRLQGDGEGLFQCKACENMFVTQAYRNRQNELIRRHNAGSDF
jgi:hypothetical protein